MPNLRWLSVFCLTGALLLPLALATFQQIAADIGIISADFIILDSVFKAPITLSQGLVIFNDSSILPLVLDRGTADVRATGSLDESDGRALLTLLENVEPKILDVLSQFLNRRTDFNNLGLAGILFVALITISDSLTMFLNALISELPNNLLIMQPYSNENLLPKMRTARLQADLANETEQKIVLTVTSALNAVIQAYEGS
ncbi:hypothetical protein DFH08DRAFT_814933 [Mycena albidolilacea]|uniref:Uncharacterized protein n=1 Tax=Mycena albidolilacea TaxID=1033008 RepID=A0AAD7EL02_9AGAR|nr:hypothetical protein DFH08DRAFT_814933 [Mycena albidolilacea]